MPFLQDALQTLGDTISGSSTVKSSTTSTQAPLITGSSKAPLIIGVASGIIALVVVIVAIKSNKSS